MNSEGLVLTACRWFFLCRMLLSCLWNSLAVLCKVASGTILVFCLQLSWAMICWWCLIYYKDAPVWLKRFLLEFQPWCRKKYSSKDLGEIVCLFKIMRTRPHAVKGIWGHYEGILVKEANISCIFSQLIYVYREGKNPNTLEIHVLHTFDSWFFIHLRQASYWCTHRKKMKGVFCWWIDVWYLLITRWSGY